MKRKKQTMASDLPTIGMRKVYKVPSLHQEGKQVEAFRLPLYVETEGGVERFRQDMEWSGSLSGVRLNKTQLTAAAMTNQEMDTKAIPYMTAPPNQVFNEEFPMDEAVRMIKRASPIGIVPIRIKTEVKFTQDDQIDGNFAVGDMQVVTGSTGKHGEHPTDMMKESMQLAEARVFKTIDSRETLKMRSRMNALIGYQAPTGLTEEEHQRQLSKEVIVMWEDLVPHGRQTPSVWRVVQTMVVREHTYKHHNSQELFKIPVVHITTAVEKVAQRINYDGSYAPVMFLLVPDQAEINAIWNNVLSKEVYKGHLETWTNPQN